jgi:hypothetical protein
MKKGVNGKQKGGAFERDVAKKLSLWVTADARPDVFWRSAMSGGRATVAHAKGIEVRQVGDITAVAPEGHVLDSLYIDCKFYKDLDLAGGLLLERGKLISFWRRTVKDAAKHRRQPWLIAKQNRFPVLLISTEEDHIIKRVSIKNPGFDDPQPACRVQIDSTPCQVWLLDEFLTLEWK